MRQPTVKLGDLDEHIRLAENWEEKRSPCTASDAKRSRDERR